MTARSWASPTNPAFTPRSLLTDAEREEVDEECHDEGHSYTILPFEQVVCRRCARSWSLVEDETP